MATWLEQMFHYRNLVDTIRKEEEIKQKPPIEAHHPNQELLERVRLLSGFKNIDPKQVAVINMCGASVSGPDPKAQHKFESALVEVKERANLCGVIIKEREEDKIGTKYLVDQKSWCRLPIEKGTDLIRCGTGCLLIARIVKEPEKPVLADSPPVVVYHQNIN